MKRFLSKCSAFILTGVLTFSIVGGSVFASDIKELTPKSSYSYNFDIYEVSEKLGEASIETLTIKDIGDSEFNKKLNDKLLEISNSAYNSFIDQLKESEDADLPEDSQTAMFSKYLNFKIMGDTSSVLSIVAVESNVMASSNVTFKSIVADKANQKFLSLSDLFTSDEYVDIISNYIKEEMQRQMETDENLSYFIGDDDGFNFEKIKENQNFYINNDGKLVILFDKYEAAPGYMGALSFIIPTDKVQNILPENSLLY